DNNINGDFVECGVWRGGSAMLIAKMLVERKITNRKIILFDTFEGMSEPSQFDIDVSGELASESLKQNIHQKETSVWCLADIVDVQNNMNQTGFSNDSIIYIKGKVEDTIPKKLTTKQVALLRLDTDWYESTKHELIYLYPLLSKEGILIVDDYGHWQGCRRAVDEYFEEQKTTLMLNRIDYTGRIAIKF
ncbi:MAG: class I SAM-dependent methyltransferase, partial [Leptonema sp. (in: Bacteria)]|nr:class I SAM-dependent methyltransferase [Leptonema sp. (in: bacteria)]